jgi:hypothetical protein
MKKRPRDEPRALDKYSRFQVRSVSISKKRTFHQAQKDIGGITMPSSFFDELAH